MHHSTHRHVRGKSGSVTPLPGVYRALRWVGVAPAAQSLWCGEVAAGGAGAVRGASSAWPCHFRCERPGPLLGLCATRPAAARDPGRTRKTMRVTSLASGSSGNALAIEHDGASLLVDAGCSPRRLARLLGEAGLNVPHLAAVLITHEHADHVAGLAAIPPADGTVLVMSHGTYVAAPNINGRSIFSGRSVVEQVPGSTLDVGPFRVTSFPVSHDGAEVVGYAIEAGGHCVAVFTDVGIAEPHLVEPLRRANLVVLEANHDEDLLWNGPYPWSLKRRVASERGHLSNAACAALTLDTLVDDTREVWLAHLSRTNNRHQLALRAVAARLERAGAVASGVRVLPQFGATVRWESTARQLPLPIPRC